MPRSEGGKHWCPWKIVLTIALISLRSHLIGNDEKLIQGDKGFKDRRTAEDKSDWMAWEGVVWPIPWTNREWKQRHGHSWKGVNLRGKHNPWSLQLKTKTQYNPKCRTCHRANETDTDIVSGRAKVAEAESKKRHDNVTRAVHWDLTGKCGFQRGDKGFKHVPESVLENENYKLMLDSNIQTDHHVKTRWPHLVVVNIREKTCQIIDERRRKDGKISRPGKRGGENVEG